MTHVHVKPRNLAQIRARMIGDVWCSRYMKRAMRPCSPEARALATMHERMREVAYAV